MKRENVTTYECDICRKTIVPTHQEENEAKFFQVSNEVNGIALDETLSGGNPEELEMSSPAIGTYLFIEPKRELKDARSLGPQYDSMLGGKGSVGDRMTFVEKHICADCAEELLPQYIDIINQLTDLQERLNIL